MSESWQPPEDLIKKYRKQAESRNPDCMKIGSAIQLVKKAIQFASDLSSHTSIHLEGPADASAALSIRIEEIYSNIQNFFVDLTLPEIPTINGEPNFNFDILAYIQQEFVKFIYQTTILNITTPHPQEELLWSVIVENLKKTKKAQSAQAVPDIKLDLYIYIFALGGLSFILAMYEHYSLKEGHQDFIFSEQFKDHLSQFALNSNPVGGVLLKHIAERNTIKFGLADGYIAEIERAIIYDDAFDLRTVDGHQTPILNPKYRAAIEQELNEDDKIPSAKKAKESPGCPAHFAKAQSLSNPERKLVRCTYDFIDTICRFLDQNFHHLAKQNQSNQLKLYTTHP